MFWVNYRADVAGHCSLYNCTHLDATSNFPIVTKKKYAPGCLQASSAGDKGGRAGMPLLYEHSRDALSLGLFDISSVWYHQPGTGWVDSFI